MKVFNLVAIAAIVAASATAPVFAKTSGSLQQDVQSAVSSSGNLNVTLHNGVATLFGYAESTDILAAERAVEKFDGVDSVRVLATQIN